MSLTLYLVRHGEAENNVRFILNSFPEIKTYALTEKGKKQAGEVATSLATVNADVIVSSPIRRAKETADIIAQVTNAPIIIDERLCEAGMGIFNEKPVEAMRKKYPQSEERLSPDPADGVESYIDIRARLTDFLSDIHKEYDRKKVIVVSHGDVLEQLHGMLTNEAPGRSAMGWYPKKGSCTEVVWNI
ncbi:MAG TPA: histidine phosphatase family protein [Patescibacteria group bacterium]|nr:histidine phosphatase family protein [Patescibacteria group bacterium]